MFLTHSGLSFDIPTVVEWIFLFRRRVGGRFSNVFLMVSGYRHLSCKLWVFLEICVGYIYKQFTEPSLSIETVPVILTGRRIKTLNEVISLKTVRIAALETLQHRKDSTVFMKWNNNLLNNNNKEGQKNTEGLSLALVQLGGGFKSVLRPYNFISNQRTL